MAKELVTKEPALAPMDWTPEQVKLIADTVAKNATPDELKLFLYRCKNMGLDPLKPGQVHFVKYKDHKTGEWGPGTMIVGIDGFRSKAAGTGKHVGTVRGILRDEKGKCMGAWAEVYRCDWQKPAREEVALAEYSTGRGQWGKMPETMIKKVAEAAALRIAFPDDLGGLFAKEEMEQAETHHDAGQDSAPKASTGDKESVEPADYVVPVTEKFRGKKLSEIPLDQLTGIVNWYLDKQAQGGDFGPAHLEFLDYAKRFLLQATTASPRAESDPHGDGVPF